MKQFTKQRNRQCAYQTKCNAENKEHRNFAIMSCVFVTGIVLRFLEVSQSLSIKNKIAAMIPIRHGSKKLNHIPTSLYRHNQIGFEDSVLLYLHQFPPLPYMPKSTEKITTMTSVHTTVFFALISKIRT